MSLLSSKAAVRRRLARCCHCFGARCASLPMDGKSIQPTPWHLAAAGAHDTAETVSTPTARRAVRKLRRTSRDFSSRRSGAELLGCPCQHYSAVSAMGSTGRPRLPRTSAWEERPAESTWGSRPDSIGPSVEKPLPPCCAPCCFGLCCCAPCCCASLCPGERMAPEPQQAMPPWAERGSAEVQPKHGRPPPQAKQGQQRPWRVRPRQQGHLPERQPSRKRKPRLRRDLTPLRRQDCRRHGPLLHS
mmetsp:Transcript_116708/g.291383  ORF Transcript_116708/g.291383 Transcript_116708/m.291383 type:complete len:245 (+) Transcript_116708:269-1003(+)